MIDYETLKTKISIRDILTRYSSEEIPFRNTYRLPCVIHQGQNCNMRIDERRGLWFCHQCHSGGDVITLMAKLENIRNGEAARRLMEERGLSLFADDFLRTVRKTARLWEGWKDRQGRPPALDEDELPEVTDLESYRGFSDRAIAHFGLRLVAGTSWGCGVFIPLRDERGELVGYTIRQNGELLERLGQELGKKPPKYLNSAGLPKGGLVYGLRENLEEIRSAGFAYVVEGQFDCIRVWDSGVQNVVAVMGSNLSPEQAAILMRHVGRLVLLFDGDDAGRQGIAQTRQRYSHLFTIDHIALPEGVDPDSADLEELGVK